MSRPDPDGRRESPPDLEGGSQARTSATQERGTATGLRPRNTTTRDRRSGRAPRRPASSTAWFTFAGIVATVAGLAWFSHMSAASRPMSAAPIFFPIAVAAGLIIAIRSARSMGLPDLAAIFVAGFSLRLLGLWLRYRDAVDANIYHEVGVRLAGAYRQLDFAEPAGREVPGTGTLRIASGAVHVLTFDDQLGAFVVFTLGAFFGCILFVRALHVAMPAADVRLYAIAMMIWPSLWFWPSSLGKEAWMLLGLGLTSLGVANIVAHRAARAVFPLVLGLIMLALVRPHVGMLAMAALGVGVLLAAPAAEGRRWTARVVVAVVLLAGGGLMSDATADRLQLDNVGGGSVTTVLDSTTDMTSQGGSEFTPVNPMNPVMFPVAVITVLFRPFPFEVSDITGLASALEGMLIMGWFAYSTPRLVLAFRSMRRLPYLLYSTAFTLMFCFAFASIANFGILVRQRSQVLPFVFVLVTIQTAHIHAARRPSARSDRLAARTS